MATFVVSTVADSGDNMAPTAGSLREAILLSNTTPGADRITFAIGSGPQTIAPPSPLPVLTDPVEIDATTQPGFAGLPLIEINGAGAGPLADGFHVNTTQSTLRGLVINRFGGAGIRLTGNGNLVAGNFIGSDITGTLDFGNGREGVLSIAQNNVIGGASPADSNLISGNNARGIAIFSPSAQSNTVVQGNLIGTDISGTLPLANVSEGIWIGSSQNVIGGVGQGQGNTIAFNGGTGVRVGSFFSTDQGNVIRGNSIVSNGALGIDLGGDGVTPNDSGDFDSGPNRRQNFPLLDAAFPSDGGTTVQGRLQSRASGSYTIDFYANEQPDPTGFGEGQIYLGSTVVTTGNDGAAPFEMTLTSPIAPGRFLTATATDIFGNTSEFSQALLVTEAASADLSASLSVASGDVRVGNELTLVANLVNNGPARATDSTLNVNLPTGFDFVSLQVSRGSGSFDSGVATLSAGTLLPGQSAQIIIRAIPRAAGAASVSAIASANEADPESENNVVTSFLTVQPPVPADLSIDAFTSPIPAVIGRSFEYTAIISNNGPGARAEGTTVSIELPEDLNVVEIASSQGTSSRDGRIITVDLGELPRFANATVRLTLTTNSTAPRDIVATVRSDSPDPNALNNLIRTPLDVLPAPLADGSVSITASPTTARVGETVSYSIVAANNGPGEAEQVVLVVELPQGADLVLPPSVSQGTIEQVGDLLTIQVGRLGPGQQAVLSFGVRAGATGVLRTSATISTDRPDLNPGNNRAELNVVVVSADPSDLAIGIVPVPQPARLGETLRYTIVTSNAGPASATGTNVRVDLPSGVELTGIRPSQGSARFDDDGTLIIDLGSLAPGGRALIDLLVVPRALGPLELVATVESAGPDFNPTDNRAVASSEAISPEAPPLVSGQRLVASPRGISSIVLAFSRPLDPVLASELSNYSIALDGARGRSIPLRSAVYDPLARTVTLTPTRPLALGRFYRLQANAPGGPGLVGLDGSVLDGDFNGLPDGIYEDLIGRGTHTRPQRLQRGPVSRDLHPARPVRPSFPLPPAPLGPAAARIAALRADR